MTKIRVGIVGCGKIFPMHAFALSQLKNVELVAVCDTVLAKAEAKAQQFGCLAYNDYQVMIKEGHLDALHICTPHYLHRQMSELAMLNGIHVLCEKPAAITLEDVLAMKQLKEQQQVALLISFQNRFNKSSQFAKELLASGQLGNVLAAKASLAWKRTDAYYSESDWKGTWEKEGGGVVIDQAIHTIDLMNWLLEMPPCEVEATYGNRGHSQIEVEDYAEGVIYYSNQLKATFNVMNYYDHDEPIHLAISCEKGNLVFFGDELVVTFHSGKEIRINKNPNDQVKIDGVKQYWGVGHQAEITYFYECLTDGVPIVLNSIETVLTTHQIITAIYQSGHVGKKIKLGDL